MKALRVAAAIATAGSLVGFVPQAAPPPERPADPQVRTLQADLQGLLDTYRWRDAQWSALVVSMDHGDTLFAADAGQPLAPASNMKLLTSAAALLKLGPSYRFRTYLVSDGRVEAGVLHGDLVLYGTGDPGISDRFYPSKTYVFEALVDALEERGVREIRGDLVGDRSFLPGPLRPEGWDPRDLNDHFAAGVSALSFNENVVSFRVEASSAPGTRPTVHTLPDHAGLPVANRATTVNGTPRPRLAILRDDPLETIRIEGGIRRGGRDVWRQLTVGEPASFTLSVFRAVLEERGIRVRGQNRAVTTPTRSVVGARSVTAPVADDRPRSRILATHISPPLRDYLEVVNKKSNNLVTELVFRTLGRVDGGTGTPQASAQAVARALDSIGVDTSGLQQTDGSGLAGDNRVTTATFVQTLQRMATLPAWWDFWATLPEAGNRRELPRMYRTAAAGNLRAKTGTIERVSALSGAVQSADGERLAFSIMVNGAPSTTRAKRVENLFGARLASFERGPGSETLPVIAQLPPPAPRVDSGGPSRHRVARGETFDEIAGRYGVTLDELLRANPRIQPRRLQAGAWVMIPQSGSGGAR